MSWVSDLDDRLTALELRVAVVENAAAVRDGPRGQADVVGELISRPGNRANLTRQPTSLASETIAGPVDHLGPIDAGDVRPHRHKCQECGQGLIDGSEWLGMEMDVARAAVRDERASILVSLDAWRTSLATDPAVVLTLNRVVDFINRRSFTYTDDENA